MQSTRKCPICLADKQEGEFRAKRRPCKSCLNEQQAARRDLNREKVREQNRRSHFKNRDARLAQMSVYGKANRASLRERQREYSSERRDHINARERANYAANSAPALERSKRWRQNNPDAFRAYNRALMARRSSHLASFARLSQAQIEARVAAFGWQCWMCGGDFEHLDHVKPLAVGGPHILANIRPACAQCNMSKGAKWFGVLRLSEFVRRSDD